MLSSLSDGKLRMKSLDLIRCESILMIESMYKMIGQSMNILLRDALGHFSKFMEDTNPVIKSLARKALHTMAEAANLSINDVLRAL